MKKSQGFTLIELVIVIVILGILAITAAPKFLNLSTDARASTVNGVKSALQSANAIIFSKAVLQNQQNGATGTVTDTRGNVSVVYGYVKATAADVTTALDVSTADYTIAQGVANSNLTVDGIVGGSAMTTADVMIYPVGVTAPAGGTTVAQACVVIYRQASSVSVGPKLQAYTQGC